MISTTGATRKVEYLLKDRLGSVDAVANASGSVIETRGYDAFGKPHNGTWNDLSPAKIASTAVTPKGFTQHEHLNQLELIHMNERAYDYNLGRFTGVDPFIQFPLNSQSLNPYSYILNNPLSGTDPSGYSSSCGDVSTEKSGNGTCTHTTGSGDKVDVKYKVGKDGNVQVKTSSAGFAAIIKDNTQRGMNGGAAPMGVTGVDGRRDQAAGGSQKGVSSAQSSTAANSGQLRMPWDRNPPDTDGSRYPLKDFPIGNLSRGIDNDGTLAITGAFSVEGDAAEDDILANMTALYSSHGKLDNGRAWRTSIQFVRASAGKAGDIQINWMNEQFFTQHPGLDRQATGGYMGFGSKSMWLNQTLFDKALLTQSNLVPSRQINEFNNYLRMFTPGHELFHGMGYGHSKNSTGSISSYERRPQMTNADFSDAWELLKDNGR